MIKLKDITKYYLDGDSKMFKGMYPNCNFAIHHNNFNHKKMFELLKEHKGGFLITYNNQLTIYLQFFYSQLLRFYIVGQ